MGELGNRKRQEMVDPLRCCVCLRNIAAGAEAQKMIIEYQQADGGLKLFGFEMPDGPITGATGAMVRAWHAKHFWMAKKREAKGDAVTGRVVPSGITGYTGIDTEAQAHLHEKIDRMRELADAMGKGVGDPQVTEAFNAQERGGPYPHVHHYRLDTYQLMAHLVYAHGELDRTADMRERHVSLHAQTAASDIRALRKLDGETEQTVRDWRPQFTAEIE